MRQTDLGVGWARGLGRVKLRFMRQIEILGLGSWAWLGDRAQPKADILMRQTDLGVGGGLVGWALLSFASCVKSK